jgi:hypothetical protein
MTPCINIITTDLRNRSRIAIVIYTLGGRNPSHRRQTSARGLRRDRLHKSNDFAIITFTFLYVVAHHGPPSHTDAGYLIATELINTITNKNIDSIDLSLPERLIIHRWP